MIYLAWYLEFSFAIFAITMITMTYLWLTHDSIFRGSIEEWAESEGRTFSDDLVKIIAGIALRSLIWPKTFVDTVRSLREAIRLVKDLRQKDKEV